MAGVPVYNSPVQCFVHSDIKRNYTGQKPLLQEYVIHKTLQNPEKCQTLLTVWECSQANGHIVQFIGQRATKGVLRMHSAKKRRSKRKRVVRVRGEIPTGDSKRRGGYTPGSSENRYDGD